MCPSWHLNDHVPLLYNQIPLHLRFSSLILNQPEIKKIKMNFPFIHEKGYVAVIHGITSYESDSYSYENDIKIFTINWAKWIFINTCFRIHICIILMIYANFIRTL